TGSSDSKLPSWAGAGSPAVICGMVGSTRGATGPAAVGTVTPVDGATGLTPENVLRHHCLRAIGLKRNSQAGLALRLPPWALAAARSSSQMVSGLAMYTDE